MFISLPFTYMQVLLLSILRMSVMQKKLFEEPITCHLVMIAVACLWSGPRVNEFEVVMEPSQCLPPIRGLPKPYS